MMQNTLSESLEWEIRRLFSKLMAKITIWFQWVTWRWWVITEEFLKESVGKFAKCKSYKGDRQICKVLYSARDYFGMDEPELCFVDQHGCVIEASNILEVVECD